MEGNESWIFVSAFFAFITAVLFWIYIISGEAVCFPFYFAMGVITVMATMAQFIPNVE